MAYEKTIEAVTGTKQESAGAAQGVTAGGASTWDKIGTGLDLPPFFKPSEELKRKGFSVTFLCNEPRKESDNIYTQNKDLWFDVAVDGQIMTWTISQISLLTELKKNAPLAGKTFAISLVPVDEVFRQKLPKYKGKDRYDVQLTQSGEAATRPLPSSSSYKTLPGGAIVEEEVLDAPTEPHALVGGHRLRDRQPIRMLP